MRRGRPLVGDHPMTSTERNQRRIEMLKLDAHVALSLRRELAVLKSQLLAEGNKSAADRIEQILANARRRIN